MPPYEPSFHKEQNQDRLAQAEAERLAKLVSRKHEPPARRTRENRGVNALLAWSEGMAIVRRAN